MAKNVLVTGAGRGIGLALTKEFTNLGYRVIGTYRRPENAKELLEMDSVLAVKADVTDEKSFAPLKEELKKLGHLDVLVNNSGVIGQKQSLLNFDVSAAIDTFNVNTFGPLRICKLALPFMKQGGTVAQITSLMGSIKDNGSGGYYDYRMSKAALNMFNMCLSKEFPQVTCLALHPGWVQTDMGGAGATVPVNESARGLLKVITGATLKQSGQFFDYRGQSLPW
jgi:NAD(P)-dependent dehydrogenase (short-subunit alcohol dehydrogenase family)